MAEVLQAKDGLGGSAGTYLTLRLGGERFAVHVACVREVIEPCRITRVPGAPLYMRGVVNVRGTATAVMDLGIRFGLGPVMLGETSRIVVLEFRHAGHTLVVGGLADAVCDVVELSASELSEPPGLVMGWEAGLVRAVARRGSDYLILLDLPRLLLEDPHGRGSPSTPLKPQD